MGGRTYFHCTNVYVSEFLSCLCFYSGSSFSLVFVVVAAAVAIVVALMVSTGRFTLRQRKHKGGKRRMKKIHLSCVLRIVKHLIREAITLLLECLSCVLCSFVQHCAVPLGICVCLCVPRGVLSFLF